MQRRFLDLVLMGLVLVLAFLAASFAVRNSDFWLHLASGRLLAEGRYPFGVDPFAFTTENHYWANHAWLFDWPLYLLYIRLGGTILVVLKAVLVSLLALVLLRMRRPGSGLGWPAACTLLAVLAMSPRLLLHSTLLSYFFLALTLWLLWRPLVSRAGSVSDGSAPVTNASGSYSALHQLRHYVPLLLLFILWVNVDSWFLLGPLLVVLFWLGEKLTPARSASEDLPHTPAWLVPVGVAVCLINPHHIHAFTLPAELMPLPEALRSDVRFAPLRTSPWQMSLYFSPLSGVNLAGGAYLVLLAVGALSFLLNVRNLTGWRLLVWLTFAGLSAWLARTIPFFAVVAAPITALNLQDAFAPAQEPPSPARRSLVGVCNFALVMSALALIVLAWPGWLQGFQDKGRHVDWAVQPDSSLRRVAEKLHLWRDKLGKGRGFLSHPSLVHYCAYFCPEEKGFLDQRLPLFRDVAESYEEICRAVNPALAPSSSKAILGWRDRLRDWGITHLVLYDPDLRRLLPALTRLADDKGAWTLLSIDGQALIVGWRDGDRLLPPEVPVFQADRLAFASSSEPEAEQMIPAAPAHGTAREPRPDDLWSHFGKPIAPSSWQTEAAAVLLYLFEARAPYEDQKRLGWAAALPGLPALTSGSLDSLMRLLLHMERAPGQQSPALPLLAVRAARQALADNPDDANAYLHLGQAYLDLARQTPEHQVLGGLPPLAELRSIQIAVALENALRRDPNSLAAHRELALLYQSRNFLDVALDHQRAVVQLLRRAGPRGEDPDAFARSLEQIERGVHALDRQVSDLRNEFKLKSRNLGSEPYHKAQLALRMGLARLALEDVLMSSALVLLGGEGVGLQVRLQLLLGRIDPVRAQLQEPDWQKNKANLGFMPLGEPTPSAEPTYLLPAYDWLLLCQTAADGDYDRAEAALQTLLQGLGGEQAIRLERDLRRNLPLVVASEVGWSAQPQLWVWTMRTAQERLVETQTLERLTKNIGQQTDLRVVSGMLSLERGQPGQAKQAFQQTRALNRQRPASLPPDPGAFLAETYLRLLAVH